MIALRAHNTSTDAPLPQAACFLIKCALLRMQVATAALARGVPQRRAQEAGAGAFAQAQSGMNSTSEAEKTFTSQVSAWIFVYQCCASVEREIIGVCPGTLSML